MGLGCVFRSSPPGHSITNYRPGGGENILLVYIFAAAGLFSAPLFNGNFSGIQAIIGTR